MDVVEELLEFIRAKMSSPGPGWVSASITACGTPLYKYEWDLSWKARYKRYIRSKMTDVPLLSFSTASSASSRSENEKWKAVGIRRLRTAIANNAADIWVTWGLLEPLKSAGTVFNDLPGCHTLALDIADLQPQRPFQE